MSGGCSNEELNVADGPHSRNLRRGRFSQAGQIYLLTMVGIGRSSVFADFCAARCVVRAMHEPSVVSVAETVAFVVMPDHVHWLVQLKDRASLGDVVRRFKARVSIVLGSAVWQRGFHDHALRKDEDMIKAARYIVANPVRAGLVRRVGDYPHWDAVWLG
jgi:REP element-mobilizing transposase RayT